MSKVLRVLGIVLVSEIFWLPVYAQTPTPLKSSGNTKVSDPLNVNMIDGSLDQSWPYLSIADDHTLHINTKIPLFLIDISIDEIIEGELKDHLTNYKYSRYRDELLTSPQQHNGPLSLDSLHSGRSINDLFMRVPSKFNRESEDGFYLVWVP